MTNGQRMKGDETTMARRRVTDDRIKNSRDRNDELTGQRRDKADENMKRNRLRNDELTEQRRDMKDGNGGIILALSLILVGLIVGILFIFI